MKRLEGKTAVVTGGNSGIGLATAKRFLEEGARVAISGRNQKTLDEAVKTLGDGVLAVQADTAKLGETEKFLAKAVQEFGKDRRAVHQRRRGQIRSADRNSGKPVRRTVRHQY